MANSAYQPGSEFERKYCDEDTIDFKPEPIQTRKPDITDRILADPKVQEKLRRGKMVVLASIYMPAYVHNLLAR